jgi:hypothetical protein
MARQTFQMASQSIQPSRDPDYKQSRAAQRQMYGTRRIDGVAKQSLQDNTPSGRAAIREEVGMSGQEAKRQDELGWRDQFKFKLGDPKELPMFLPDPSIAQPQPLARVQQGLATPEDILDAYSRGETSGVFRTPYDTPGGGVAFGDAASKVPFGTSVVPQSNLPASAMTDFLPKQPRGYMSSVLDAAPRWQKPLTRYG